jgi:hypothetical protein
MIKTLLLALACGTAGAAIVPLFGATEYSSDFQCSYPIGSSIKTVLDPANIWSWTGEIPSGGQLDILVDIDGDQQMDTVHPGLRVVITDAVSHGNYSFFIDDSSGRRLKILGNGSMVSPNTPIVLPVDSFLRLISTTGNPSGGPDWPITLIGRVVNL